MTKTRIWQVDFQGKINYLSSCSISEKVVASNFKEAVEKSMRKCKGLPYTRIQDVCSVKILAECD